MTDDIVTRLRAHNPFSSPYMDEITHAAADEIERLRGALDDITKGAKKILIECEKLDNWNGHGEGYNSMSSWVEEIAEERQ